ncbi:MAG: type II toxin-antitoxin system VapC family toxin [Candidatus Poribacteria bacterium]|nr:type II toxin-antitoxin system VapC family toxin [Candidatus Poribacteria bacterium]
MNFFWLDASAYAKRYVAEKGTQLINYLFTRVPLERMVCLSEGGGEIIFVFVRRRNEGRITTARFSRLREHFETEFIDRDEVGRVLPTEDQITDSWNLIEKYSLNSTDAILLQCAFDRANELRMNGDNLVLVSSDKRLLRAAQSEGLLTFDPESDSQTALDVFINSP